MCIWGQFNGQYPSKFNPAFLFLAGSNISNCVQEIPARMYVDLTLLHTRIILLVLNI